MNSDSHCARFLTVEVFDLVIEACKIDLTKNVKIPVSSSQRCAVLSILVTPEQVRPHHHLSELVQRNHIVMARLASLTL